MSSCHFPFGGFRHHGWGPTTSSPEEWRKPAFDDAQVHRLLIGVGGLAEGWVEHPLAKLVVHLHGNLLPLQQFCQAYPGLVHRRVWCQAEIACAVLLALWADRRFRQCPWGAWAANVVKARLATVVAASAEAEEIDGVGLLSEQFNLDILEPEIPYPPKPRYRRTPVRRPSAHKEHERKT